MLRRLGLGVLALIALGLVTSRPAAAQDQGMGMGMSDSGSSGMSMPGMGMGMPGMPGMGMWGMGMGMPGMPGMGMPGMGMGMSGMGMFGRGSYQGPGAGMAPAFATAIHHPGDLSLVVPCTGCGALADPCSFGGRCSYMEAGLWPDNLGLHPTTNHADLTLYWPEGPLSCMRGRAGNPASCVDAPGEWNLRTGIPGVDPGAAGTSR